MICLYSGTGGSGKSMHMARNIYDWIKNHDGVIISNFRVDKSLIKGKQKGVFIYCNERRITPKRIFNFCIKYNQHYYKDVEPVEGRYILIIDEAQRLFNPRDWNTPMRRDWLTFFTMHRKPLLDIYLIAPQDRMLDRNVRGVIEFEYVHRKVANYGGMGAFVGFFFKGKIFAVIKKWYPMREKVDSEFFVGRKKFMQIYNTHDLIDSDELFMYE